MPIRFRCPHCNQLLGIARRKAGTQVQCPTCNAAVHVPPGEADDDPPSPLPPVAPQLFERSDFENYLKEPLAEGPAHRGATPAAEPLPVLSEPPPAPAAEVFDLGKFATPAPIPPAPRPQPPGLFLTPTQATLLTVTTILFIALAFGAGLWVGRLLP
jgi:hypothetical protein